MNSNQRSWCKTDLSCKFSKPRKESIQDIILGTSYTARFTFDTLKTSVVCGKEKVEALQTEVDHCVYSGTFSSDFVLGKGGYHIFTDEEPAASMDTYQAQSVLQENPSLADALAVYPQFDDHGRYPFDFATIRHYQQQSANLKQQFVKMPKRYQEQQYGTIKLICHVEPNKDNKIVLTKDLMKKIVSWYHKALSHVERISRMEEALCQMFHHPKLRDEIKNYVKTCDICQRYKRGSRQYGILSACDATLMPWQEIHCDTVGPWTIELRAKTLTFKAVTVIDPVTNLVEINPLIICLAS